MPNHLIRTVNSQEERQRKQLNEAIARKQKRLMMLTARFESLRMELEFIKQEYHVRIGRLILKDSQLDLEIIRFRNILSLMEKGMSYEDAVMEIEKEVYNEKIDFEFEFEQIEYEEEMLKKRQQTSEDSASEIKTLWRKLLLKFHPDLAVDAEEKERRHGLMKKINKAYSEQDIMALRSFDTQLNPEDFQESSIEFLERTIVEIDNMIIKVQQEYADLKVSEWFGWRKKFHAARKKNQDIFKELERDLLDDVVRKIEILNTLKKSTGQLEFA